MRKLLLAVTMMLFVAGLVVAADVSVVSFDKEKKEVTVKEGDKETTYKISDKIKVTMVSKDKDGNETKTEGKYEDLEKRLAGRGGKGGKGGTKLSITTDKDTITEVTYTGRAKKN